MNDYHEDAEKVEKVTEISTRLKDAIAAAERVETPPPGIYPNVPFEHYQQWKAINCSTLHHFARSAMHAREEMLHPKAPTPAKETGHAFHMALLEPQRFEMEVVPALTIARRSNADKATWREFEHANRDRLILDQVEIDDFLAMQKAVYQHPACSTFLTAEGLNEVSFIWLDEITGELCKGREDMMREHVGYPFLVNLKTTKNASPEPFSRDINKYGYHVAGAMYQDGMKALGQDGVRFCVMPVEKDRPYGCAVYELDDTSLDIGRSKYRSYLRTYAECKRTNEWPGYAPQMDYISIPAFAMKGWSDGD